MLAVRYDSTQRVTFPVVSRLRNRTSSCTRGRIEQSTSASARTSQASRGPRWGSLSTCSTCSTTAISTIPTSTTIIRIRAGCSATRAVRSSDSNTTSNPHPAGYRCFTPVARATVGTAIFSDDATFTCHPGCCSVERLFHKPRRGPSTPRLRPSGRVPRDSRGAHVPLLLGPGQHDERPRPRSVPYPVFLQYRRRRIRAHRLSDRCGARVHHARPGAPACRHHAPLLLDRAPGLDHRRDRLPRLLLSLPRYEFGSALPAGGALDHRYGAAAWRRAVLPVVLHRPDRPDRGGDPPARRLDLPPCGLAVGLATAAGRVPGVASGVGLSRVRLARLQRGDDPLHPRPRLADTRRGHFGVVPMDLAVPVGHVLRPDAPRLRTPIRAPVLARVGRLQRYPGRVHEGTRDRLFRELAPGHVRATGLRGRQSGRLDQL